MYYDDVQLYTYFNPNDHVSIVSALNNLSGCTDVIKIWMQSNMLKPNDNKNWVICCCTCPSIGDKLINPSERVRNLGIIFDSQMSMSGHVNNLCSSLSYQLRNISIIRRFLDYDTCTCHLVVRVLVLIGSTIAMGCYLVLIKAIFKDYSVSRTGLRSWQIT